MPSLRESQDIKKALRGNETPKDYLLKWETQCGASGSAFIFYNKKDYLSIVSFLRRWRDLNPRATLMTYTLSRGTSSAS